MSKFDKTCSVERSDVYLVNKSSLLEPVNRVYATREKSQSLLDHPRICILPREGGKLTLGDKMFS